MLPALRERKRRARLEYGRAARDWFAVLASAAIIAMALVTMTLLAVILAGCTTMSDEQQRATGGHVLNITEMRKSE